MIVYDMCYGNCAWTTGHSLFQDKILTVLQVLYAISSLYPSDVIVSLAVFQISAAEQFFYLSKFMSCNFCFFGVMPLTKVSTQSVSEHTLNIPVSYCTLSCGIRAYGEIRPDGQLTDLGH